MEELVKIHDYKNEKLVNARELHEFLGSQSRFNDWIANRIKKYEFVEGEDYVSFTKNLVKPKGGRPTEEYGLKIDMAKELAMVENNDKGRLARKYFIEVEKKYKEVKQLDFSDPDNVLMLARNWKEEHDKRVEAEKQIKALKPKAELMEKVLDSEEMIDIGQAAKILELPFGRNTLFARLREIGVFFKGRNEPKQQYVKRGLFVLKEKYIERNNHDGFTVIKVLVTQKGLSFLNDTFGSNDGTKYSVMRLM